MCPTVEIATEKCKRFLEINRNYVYRFSKRDLMVGLTGGIYIYFRGKTQEQRAIIGTHAKIVNVDEFLMEIEDLKYYTKNTDLQQMFITAISDKYYAEHTMAISEKEMERLNEELS